MKTWTATGVGPIQASKFNKAWSRAGSAFSVWSKKGGYQVHIIALGAGRSAEEIAALTAVGDQFGWTLTRENIGAATKVLLEVARIRTENAPDEDQAPCGCNGAVPHKKAEHVARYVAPGKEPSVGAQEADRFERTFRQEAK